MEKKVLFLDFDGVLFDTLKEVYLVNRQLYKGISLFDEVDNKNYQLYSKFKYLVYNIWMFYYYNPLLFDGCSDIEKTFLNAILKRDLKAEQEFCAEFLQIRADLVKNNYDFWNGLEEPYKFFFEIKKLYEEESPEIVVVSKKNKTAIAQRFASYGWDLPQEKIFAREILDKYSTKGEFMAQYMSENGYSEALFVDDNNNNLKTCDKYPNIKQILALWGNCQPNLSGFNQEEAINEIKIFLK